MPDITTDDQSWPDDVVTAYLLADPGGRRRELLLTRDGRALLDGLPFVVLERIPVAERRAGRAAVAAGRL